MRTINKKRFLEIFKEITETCDCKNGYCFWSQLVKHQQPDLRMLIQLECIDKFKYEESEHQKTDIGSSTAAMKWVEDGYAKAFSEVYDENLSIKEIYKRTIEKVKK